MSTQGNGSRKSLLRTRNVVGGGVLVGVLFGLYMADFFKGPGQGGSGPAVAKSDRSNDTRSSADPTMTGTSSQLGSPANNEVDIVAKPFSRDAAQTVRLLIDERSYYVMSDQGEQHEVSLDDVVRLVKNATGDSDGIKIRIFRKKTSRPSAEEKLKAALQSAGLGKESVYEHPALVE